MNIQICYQRIWWLVIFVHCTQYFYRCICHCLSKKNDPIICIMIRILIMTYYDDYHYTLRKNIIMRISYIKVFPNKHRHLILLPRKL